MLLLSSCDCCFRESVHQRSRAGGRVGGVLRYAWIPRCVCVCVRARACVCVGARGTHRVEESSTTRRLLPPLPQVPAQSFLPRPPSPRYRRRRHRRCRRRRCRPCANNLPSPHPDKAPRRPRTLAAAARSGKRCHRRSRCRTAPPTAPRSAPAPANRDNTGDVPVVAVPRRRRHLPRRPPQQLPPPAAWWRRWWLWSTRKSSMGLCQFISF